MRNTDEQLREIMNRANYMKERKAAQRAAASYAIASCICILLLVVTSFYLPALSAPGGTGAPVHYGSLLLNASYMSYVVIGLIAFLLGICVTLLCLHLRELRKN